MKTRLTAMFLSMPAMLLLAGCAATTPYTPYPAGKFPPPSAYHHPAAASPARASQDIQPAEIVAPAGADEWSQPVPASAGEATDTPAMSRETAPAEDVVPPEASPQPAPPPPQPVVEDTPQPAADEIPQALPAAEEMAEPPPADEAAADEVDDIPVRDRDDEPYDAVPRSRIEEMSERYAQGAPAPGATTGGAEVDDRQLAADVLNRLRDDTMTGRMTFGTASRDGMVTVEGAVPDEAMRTRALGIVRSTPGVRGVIDRLSRYR